MTDLFRWQWMWTSRRRLIGFALAAIAVGGLILLYVPTAAGRWDKPRVSMFCLGVMVLGMGVYQLLQGLLSPAGAFGDHDDTDGPRLRPALKRWKRETKPDDAPLPLAVGSSEETPLPLRAPARERQK